MLNGLGIDEYFRRTDTSGASNLLTDALGSTLALTNSSGAIQTSYTYETFGNTTVGGTSSSSPFQFTGRENDGTELYYYRARYYSPSLSRFLSEDPLEFGGGNDNFYAYAADDSIDIGDPFGLKVVFAYGPKAQALKKAYQRVKSTKRGWELCRNWRSRL
jgi:RHS repeat-associated protein